MGEPRRGVDMVRLEKEEEVYEVEAVLGRDAASVFPSMSKSLDPMEQLKTTIGAKRFVTETELEEIKAARGLTVDDGTLAADKPLAEILAEKKKAKQDAFDDMWKQMKTGKNRPLDPDELEFLETLARREAAQEAQLSAQEAEELEAYRAAVAAAAEAKAAAAAAAAGGGEGDAGAAEAGPGSSGGLARSSSGGRPRPGMQSKQGGSSKAAVPAIRPIVKVKPKAAAAAAEGGSQTQPAAAGGGSSGAGAKRPRLAPSEQQQQQQQQQEPAAPSAAGLAGLLGGYGSDDEDDS